MSGGNTGLWSGILMIQDNNQLITAICKDSLDNRHSDLQINLKGRTGNCPLTGGKLTSCTTFSVPRSVCVHCLSQEMLNIPNKCHMSALLTLGSSVPMKYHTFWVQSQEV